MLCKPAAAKWRAFILVLTGLGVCDGKEDDGESGEEDRRCVVKVEGFVEDEDGKNEGDQDNGKDGIDRVNLRAELGVHDVEADVDDEEAEA